MDELDKLKGAWKAQDYSRHRVSTTDIYKMLHAKSTSYVKWIFYISIIELLLVVLINVFIDNDQYLKFFNDIGLEKVIKITTVISYVIMFAFIYLFYKNYRAINVDTNAKTLMKSILKTRKTVKTYIYFNICFIAISSILLFNSIFSNPETTRLYKIENNIPEEFSTTLLFSIQLAFLIFMIVVILIFYRIIYGILLRRLKKNYKELEQLDK